MSSKFGRPRPPYRRPPWCIPPWIIPPNWLAIVPDALRVSAEIRYPLGLIILTVAGEAIRIPRLSPTTYAALLPASFGRDLQVNITWNRTTNKINVGLTALLGFSPQASATTLSVSVPAEEPLDFSTDAFPFVIPSGATARAHIWL
jgi:hypothetical protein